VDQNTRVYKLRVLKYHNGDSDMRLTSKGRYAVSAMVDLSKHQNDGTVNLTVISLRQDISLSYLEQLFRKLRESGLIRSVRGPGGGYRLNKPANEITITEIITAVHETIDATRCANAVRGCHNGVRCETHTLWDSLTRHTLRFLDAITLEDVCTHPIRLEEVNLQPVKHYLPKN
ncbi:MAG: Rrf2 family transcriptional regulator, partial [Mariprofundaceae bacterium]